MIIEALGRHGPGLLRNRWGSEVLELAYNDFANQQQRSDIMVEFYGKEFALNKVLFCGFSFSSYTIVFLGIKNFSVAFDIFLKNFFSSEDEIEWLVVWGRAKLNEIQYRESVFWTESGVIKNRDSDTHQILDIKHALQLMALKVPKNILKTLTVCFLKVCVWRKSSAV